jgi:monofunctional biosynthetic peptidoglycan transglycosylase
MRKLARAMAGAAAAAFGCVCYVYLSLPDVRPLRTSNPSTTAFIELRAREAAARGEPGRADQRWVPYSRVSSALKRAVLVAEDSAFWDHEGIDVEQIRESIEVNLERMEFARGASTITQQLAKNLYLSPSKNPSRKLRELFITRRLEHELSKQRILELYLNVIEWGAGVYGAESAARQYFGKPASALGAQEAALLAGAIINPRLLNPARPTARLRRRQQMLLARMGRVVPPTGPTIETEPPEPLVPVSAQPGSEAPTLPGSPLPPEETPPEPAVPELADPSVTPEIAAPAGDGELPG